MKIACVLVTHLPVKVELQRRPDLAEKLVLVVEGQGSKRTVLDHSSHAAGVSTGMPLQHALARCGEAALVEADLPAYRLAFERILDALEQRSPLVEPGELGCAYVGLDGLEAMYDGEARLMESLLHAVPDHYDPRLGVAEGKFPAHVAAILSGPGRTTRAPQDGESFMRDLPVETLPVAFRTVARLRAFGLERLGQVASLPVGALQAQFGPEGRLMWELARGVDRSPLVARRTEQTVSESLSFPSPTTSLGAVAMALESMVGRAYARHELHNQCARLAVLEADLYRASPWVVRIPFKEPVGDKARALFIIKARMEGRSLPAPAESLTLTLSGLTGEAGRQESLFRDVRRREQLREAVRQMEASLGRKPPIYQVRELEPWSRYPERRAVLAPYEP